MGLKPETIGRVSLLLLTFICIFIRFNEFFHNPNSKVIEPYGDGFKAYTVIIYHVKHDSTWSHFEGMNYPYGDHVVPGACQPILSNTIKLISKVVDISDYTIAIIHFSMLLSILLCSWFLYLIFRRLDLPIWYSIVVALGVTFLAPQLHRMTSHYGLAHPEVLPIVMYLLMRFEERKHWKNSLLMALVVFIYSQIHFYYFAIMAFTISFYFLFSFIATRWNWEKLPKYIVHYIMQIILPLIFFFWWLYFDDPVTDRSDSPWGFFAYRAHLEGVFTSMTQPHWEYWHENITKIRKLDFEAKSYVGLVAMFAFAVLLFRWIGMLFKKPLIPFKPKHHRFLSNLFFAALVILIFSLGVPFIFGLESWVDYTGPIRQFRSIGRFAWVFYYAMNIIAFACLYHWVSQNKSRKWMWGLVGIALLLLYYEAYNYVYGYNMQLDQIDEFAEGQQFTEISGVDYKEYQAIVPIPYYNIGSDNFWVDVHGYIGQKSKTLSIQTGLPVTGAMLTRTSLSQTINQLQLVHEPYRRPKILDDFPNNKALLMTWHADRAEDYGDKYTHLLEESQLVYQKKSLQFYRVPLSSFATRLELRKQRILNDIRLDSALFEHDGLLSPDSVINFVYQPMDDLPADQFYMGGGGFQGVMREQNTLYDGPVPGGQTGKYYFNVWMYIASDLNSRTDVVLEEYNPETGEVLNRQTTQVRRIVGAIDNNGWADLEWAFDRKAGGSHVRIHLQNKKLQKKPIFIDELLIYPADTPLYKKTADQVWMNNRWFPIE